MRERSRVGPQAQIALHKHRLRGEWNGEGGESSKNREGSARWIDPEDARRGEDNFKAVAQELAAELGKAANQMNAVAALRHVGFGAALKVAIAEAWNLFQKCQAQADFETASEAQ